MNLGQLHMVIANQQMVETMVIHLFYQENRGAMVNPWNLIPAAHLFLLCFGCSGAVVPGSQRNPWASARDDFHEQRG